MTIEQKAKAYDEAIKKVNDYYEGKTKIYSDVDKTLEYIFPELKESEDEKIKKFIIKTINQVPNDSLLWETISKSSVLTWLEKQGEQKPTIIIPNFRVGDNIKTTNEEPLTITKIDEKGYWSEDLFICGFDDTAKWELVEQKPTWSKEDEVMLNNIGEYLCRYGNDIAESNEGKAKEVYKLADWLKSLRPQTPSLYCTFDIDR